MLFFDKNLCFLLKGVIRRNYETLIVLVEKTNLKKVPLVQIKNPYYID